MKFEKNITKIKGDASYRVFYRKRKRKSSSILVHANKEKKSNLLIYDSVNKILIANKILAPKLLSENYSKNYIEIQDFGTDSVYSLLKKKRLTKYRYLKK